MDLFAHAHEQRMKSEALPACVSRVITLPHPRNHS